MTGRSYRKQVFLTCHLLRNAVAGAVSFETCVLRETETNHRTCALNACSDLLFDQPRTDTILTSKGLRDDGEIATGN